MHFQVITLWIYNLVFLQILSYEDLKWFPHNSLDPILFSMLEDLCSAELSFPLSISSSLPAMSVSPLLEVEVPIQTWQVWDDQG